MKSLKEELESRPSKEDYQEKIQRIDELNNLLVLTEEEKMQFMDEITKTKTKFEQLQQELCQVKDKSSVLETKISSMQTIDAIAQTEMIQITETSTNTSLTDPTISPKAATQLKFENKSEPVPSDKPSGVEELSDIAKYSPDSSQIDSELKLIHHPDVQREEELIIFKEKYTILVEEKLKLDQELLKLREDYQQYRNKSIIHLLIYLAPVFALISYLFMYFTK